MLQFLSAFIKRKYLFDICCAALGLLIMSCGFATAVAIETARAQQTGVAVLSARLNEIMKLKFNFIT